MAYFLKKSNLKKGTYLQIYYSFYDKNKKQTRHKSIKTLGYVDDLINEGINNPIEHFSNIVKKMNDERNIKIKNMKQKKISLSPRKYLGYFPIKHVFNYLNLKADLNLLQFLRDFQFQLSDLIEALIYSRMIKPASKKYTYEELIPRLWEDYDFSYDQILSGLKFLGEEYEKVVEIFSHHVNEKFSYETDFTYFDGTNFFFEIDKEDDFRKKGPSKENRPLPLVSLGLLLDKNQIPLGMNIFPGNESEMPKIRETIKSLKRKNNIKGRTIQVRDKGLNCSQNIVEAKKDGDGYIFSKSVKKLPYTEKRWILNDVDWIDVRDDDGNILFRYKSCVDSFPYTYIDKNGDKKKVNILEKRVVSFNPSLKRKKELEIKKEVEKATNLCLSRAKRKEFGDCGKYVSFKAMENDEISDSKVISTINMEKVEEDLSLAGYNLIVTSEVKMDSLEIYNAYHNLWKIEETFKLMKSELDARPVYLQEENKIKGHFLICYLSVLLERILEVHILEDEYNYREIFELIREFELIENDEKYINISKRSRLLEEIERKTNLPILNFYLNKKDVEKVLNYKL